MSYDITCAGTEAKMAAWHGLAKVAYATGLTRIGTPPSNAILMYHSVGGTHGNPGGRFPTARLRADLSRLRKHYRIVDLPAVLDSGEQPRLAITFDDGYRDFVTEALPVLESLDVPATLFVSTALVGADRRDPRSVGLTAAPDEMLTESQMRAVAAHDLVTLGNHTATHPALPTLDVDHLHREIVGAKETLEQRYEVEVTRFCYPGGKHDHRSRKIVERTHDLGVGVNRGLIDPPVSREEEIDLPRINAAREQAVVYWETSSLGEYVRRCYRRFRA